MSIKIPYISITFCQQGGIGWSPAIVYFYGRWRAVSDSREEKPSERLEPILEHQTLVPRTKQWHPQAWALHKFNTAPKIKWHQIEGRIFGFPECHSKCKDFKYCQASGWNFEKDTCAINHDYCGKVFRGRK